jgi:hypothetical protein
MKLITEVKFDDVELITEAKENGDKDYYIHGIFLQAEQQNRNGRIYRMPIMEREVNRYVNEVVKDNRAWGELGHPSGPQINLDRVSHIITELKRDGNNFIGKAKLTDTPNGNIAKGLMKAGKLGVSSRGMGSLKPVNGIMEVQDDFHLATAADIVADPSAPKAFVKGILEGVDYWFDAVSGSWKEEKLYTMKTHMHSLNKEQLEEQKLYMFKKYMKLLQSK